MRERPALLPGAATGTVVTVGTFDGMHRGHMLVVERTAARARSHGMVSVALTFDPHPLDVVNPSAAPPLLTLWPEKLELISSKHPPPQASAGAGRRPTPRARSGPSCVSGAA